MIGVVLGRLAIPAVALACLLTTPAWAAGEKVNADWVQKPTGEELAAAYPPIANALQIEGRVVLFCAITVNGVLAECVAESETPKGLGFADAAMLMKASFRMRPTTIDGRPRGGDTMRIPIGFRLPPPPPPVDQGPPTSPQALDIARKLVVAEDLKARLAAIYGADAADRELWRRVADDATVAAGMAARQQAIEAFAPAWMEGAARGYAALFTEDHLAAALAYAESPGGQAAWRKSSSVDSLGASLSWVTFRHGLSLARNIFCKTHDCLRDDQDIAKSVDRQPAILTPDWLERPKPWQVAQATPLLAAALSVPGEVGLRCKVTELGLLYDCAVQHQSPNALGFGTAALEIAKFYRAQPLPPGATAAVPSVGLLIRFPELTAEPPPFGPLPQLDPNPSEIRLELARQIMEASDIRTGNAKVNLQNMEAFDAMPSPGVDAKTRSEVRAAIQTGGDQAIEFFISERAKQYAGLFTETELRGMLAWELSPAGAARRVKRDRLMELATANSTYFDSEVSRRAGAIFCASQGCTTKIAPFKP